MTPCPVAAIAQRFGQQVSAYRKAEDDTCAAHSRGKHDLADQFSRAQDIADGIMDALTIEAEYHRTASAEGAAFQVALMSAIVQTLLTNDLDEMATLTLAHRLRRLIYSVLLFLVEKGSLDAEALGLDFHCPERLNPFPRAAALAA